MSFTESTPVTIHTHTGASSTVTYHGPVGPPQNYAAYDTIDSLASDQSGDAVLGTAVLAGGSQVVISASLANNVNYNGIGTYPGYPAVYETIIDNGVVTGTHQLTLPGSFVNAPTGEDLLRIVPLTGGDFVLVNEARATDTNLYFELFDSSGNEIGSATPVNASGSTHAIGTNDTFNLVATSTNGFVIEWNEGNNQTGHLETFDVNGTTVTNHGSVQFHDGTNDGTDGFIGNTAVATNGNVIVATNPVGAGSFASANFAIYTASGGTVVAPESFATAESGKLPDESSALPGDSGNPLENSYIAPQFVALPSGGFLAVIANPTGPYSSANNGSFPGFNMYLQTISATGVFGTPELVETTTNGIADNSLNPVVLSDGDVVVDIGGHYGQDSVFNPGTFEVIDPSKVPANISTLVAMTPLFPSAVAPTVGVVSPTGAASTTAQVVIPNGFASNTDNADRFGVAGAYFSADNHGGVFAALQSGIYTGFGGYGTLDANLYAADFDPDPPTVAASGSIVYSEQGAAQTIDAGVTVADPNGAMITGATVTISTGYLAGDALSVTLGSSGLTVASNTGGVLTLTGSASASVYQQVLDSVAFFNPGQNPDDYGSDPTRTVTFQVKDANATSASSSSMIDITAVNNPTVLGGAGGTVNYTEQQVSPVVIDSGITVTDPDNLTLAGATVSIESPVSGDELRLNGDLSGSITDAGGTINYSFDGTTLSLTGTDTLADYQAALALVTFDSTGNNPTLGGAAPNRVIDFQANDGVALSVLVQQTVDIAPCYCPGSLILTDRGEVSVESLRIGDLVVTASGATRPIKWIGTRAYSARFARNNADAHPICFKAGSLAENTPHRDLWVSPKHAMFLDGVLIPAECLVNGATVTRPLPETQVQYFHVELESHDVLVANGAASESFLDDDSRAMFHNAETYTALYPGEPRRVAAYCAPRVEDGHALARVRRRLALRAGLPVAPDIELGALEGEIETLDATGVSGWARSAAFPNAPVCLDVRVDGELVGYAYADGPSVGGGRGFALRFETPVEAAQLRRLEVTRSADGAALKSRVASLAA